MQRSATVIMLYIHALVIVSVAGLKVCAGSPIGNLAMEATSFEEETTTMLSLEATTKAAPGNETRQSRGAPSWYFICVACGGFAGGVATSALCYCARQRLKRKALNTLNGEKPSKLSKQIPHLLSYNIQNAFHYLPDILAQNYKSPTQLVKHTYTSNTKCGRQNSATLHRLLSTHSTNSSELSPFMTQFSEVMTSEGGEMLSPDSDVSVIIPPGAVPVGRMQPVYVNVSLSQEEFGISTKQTEYQLTPVVECLAPGLDRFLRPVIVKMPHRADVTNASDPWTFNAKYSQSPVGKQMNWYNVPRKANNGGDVTFTYDADFVYFHTTHFTSFTCTGCGKSARPPLKLSAVVYGNEKTLDGAQQVNMRVYICDTSADIQKRISTMERAFNGSQQSQFKPISVHNSKSFEIELKSVRDEKWPWRILEQDQTLKEIPMDVCYHCCNSPPSVDFRCTTKESGTRLNGIEATFTVSQVRRKREEMTYTELVTHNFEFEAHSLTNEVNRVPASDSQMEALHLAYIKQHLLPRDLPGVARALHLTESDIMTIQRDYRDNSAEQIYQIVSLWMTRQGYSATCRAFCEALESVQIQDVADGLRRLGMSD